MPCCLAVGCNNRTYNKSQAQDKVENEKKITFHRFPKDHKRRLKWADIMTLNRDSLPMNIFLCSIHFSEDQFDRTSLACVRLKDNAVPNQNIYNSKDSDYSDTDVEIIEIKVNTSKGNSNSNVMGVLIEVDDKENTKKNKSHNLQIINEPQFESCDTRFNHEHGQFSNVNATDHKEITQGRNQTLDLSEDIECRCSALTSTTEISSSGNPPDTPRKVQSSLRKTIFNERNLYKRQIRSLKQKNRRQRKKIIILSSIINDLKQNRLLEHKHLDLLQTIGQSNV